MEEEPSGSKRKPPSCSRCSNHGKDSPLTHHKCPYEVCDCLLCKLTWARKEIMRRQQQLWRSMKETTQRYEEAAEGAGGGGAGGCGTGEGEGEDSGGKQKEKYCDMCRNHGVLVRNRGHKRSCKYESCLCGNCSFTRKRRHIMQLQQKVKRSKFTTQQFQEATEWVVKLTAEISSLQIDDAPMPPAALVASIPHHPPPSSCLSSSSSSNLHPHGPFFPSPAEGSFPSTIQGGFFHQAHPVESFPSPSCPRKARPPFMPQGPPPNAAPATAVAVEQQYPSSSSSSSSSFPMESGGPVACAHASSSSASSSSSPISAAAVAAAAASGPSFSNSSTSSIMHIPMESPCSFAATLCTPSPSFTSQSASPATSDYDPSYPSCPSPLPYLCTDINVNREMASHQMPQSCAVLRNTASAEPLECSDHHMHSYRSHIHAKDRLQEHTEDPTMHTNRSSYSTPQGSHLCWRAEQRNLDEMAHGKSWLEQRRKSEGVIQPTSHHKQRRHSDGIIQGQRSDGVIKKVYSVVQRGNSDTVIQEGYSPEHRGNTEDDSQLRHKTDLCDSGGRVIEKYPGAEERFHSMYQYEQRRKSDGAITPPYILAKRRSSEGMTRKCPLWNPRGSFDRGMPKHFPYPLEGSDGGTESPYRDTDRSSDDISQDSNGVDQRRNSSDYAQDSEWPYQRSDNGETIPEVNPQNQRRDSDEFIYVNYPARKDHFFENTLRRREAMERFSNIVPMTDVNMDHSGAQEPHLTAYLPPGGEQQQATAIQGDGGLIRVEDDVSTHQNVINWGTHYPQGETNLPFPHDTNDEEMEQPIDLTTKPSQRH